MDLNDFQLGDHSLLPVKGLAPRPQGGIKGRFLKGPIPLGWLIRAAPLPGKALPISLCIWFLKWVNGGNTVKLSYKLLKEFGVSRSSSYRGLKSLEDAGLVTVEQHSGRSPIVTLKDQVENTPDGVCIKPS
jgi:DNA-binding transcriptional ArsR family regulator